MKKLFGIFILTLYTLTSSVNIAQSAKKSETASPTVTTVEYQLPYPGILPDHPLYKIKVLRDKILLLLTFNPIKKAARHLHMADKEFLMSLKLAENNNIPLAQQTAFKAEHHMTLLVAEIENAVYYSRKEFPQDLARQAHQATLKHQELLTGIMNRAGEKDKNDFETIKEFSIRNGSELFRFEHER